MCGNYKVTIGALFFFIYFCSPVISESSKAVQYFDYQSATNIIVYSSEGDKSIWFPKPLEIDHSKGPAILYRDILAALSNAENLTVELPDPRYIIDIQSESSYKRLYLGDKWLSDRTIVSNFDGINPVLSHIEKRFAVGLPADYSMENAEKSFNVAGKEGDEGLQSIGENVELKSIATALDKSSNLVGSYYPFGQIEAVGFDQTADNDIEQYERGVRVKSGPRDSSEAARKSESGVFMASETVIVKGPNIRKGLDEAMVEINVRSSSVGERVPYKDEHERGSWMLFSIISALVVIFYLHIRKGS